MNIRKLSKLLGVIILALCFAGCSSERKLTRKEMEEVKEAKIKALEEMYPGRQFEVYDMKQYGDMYGYFQEYYFRCLNDGITFDHDSFSDDGPQQYIWTKWDNDGKVEIEKDIEDLFGRNGYATYTILLFEGIEDNLNNPDLTVFEAIDKYYEQYKGGKIYFECMLYTNQEEQINWKKESEAIYAIYEKYIVPYVDLPGFEYDVSFIYFKPGAGHYEKDYIYTHFPVEFLLQRVDAQTDFPFHSADEIYQLLIQEE